MRRLTIFFFLFSLASCTQPEKMTAPSKASPRGSRVSAVGKVTMHGGQPCTSQIMFDFRITGARSIFQVAAPMRETKLLTEAVKQNRRVRIWGNWQHGAAPGCNYVHVTKVEPLSLAVLY
jgi:hypothetical protein